MVSAKALLMPSTFSKSSRLAAITPRRPPNRVSNAWRRLLPIPGISLSEEVTRALSRFLRWPVMAKRCDSSRTVCNKCKAGLLGGRRKTSPVKGSMSSYIPALRSWPLAIPTKGMCSPSSSHTDTATPICPLPPSINTTSGHLTASPLASASCILP